MGSRRGAAHTHLIELVVVRDDGEEVGAGVDIGAWVRGREQLWCAWGRRRTYMTNWPDRVMLPYATSLSRTTRARPSSLMPGAWCQQGHMDAARRGTAHSGSARSIAGRQ